MLALRRIVALLLLFVMLFCVAKNSVLYTFYSLNADAFISLFCENVDRPIMKCNGKCKLSKMAKEEQKEQAEKILSTLQQEVFFYHSCNSVFNITDFYAKEGFRMLFSSVYNNNYAYLYFLRDDKPPQFLS